jgi:hypothetical protein
LRCGKLAEKKNSVKKRTAVWIYPETIEEMDSLLEKDNCKSRSEFIDKALNFYMGYLVSEDTTGYLSKINIPYKSLKPQQCREYLKKQKIEMLIIYFVYQLK